MSKFIPCPICHGKGGHFEVILEDGSGEYHKAICCNGERTLEAYERIKKENFMIQQYEESIICQECFHDATWHYKSYSNKDVRDRERESHQVIGCGYTEEQGDEFDGFWIQTCNCTQYKEDLLERE